MRNQLLHTPEGVRDIYNGECEKKLMLQEKLHATLKHYGYHSIQTPSFEFFDIFGKEVGTIPSRDLYKFFDREGNTLVLRPDITPSIARSVAKYFQDEDLPIRLCYMGN
ncbi:MAG: ATP phosphoribosyltransferase regulatory subunit, partial [Lachnospiraceae bacterium]|nr:ATP phosphoribosyltransferase regulatory subunit [Lachnospiraceae bacterium]